MISSSLFGTQQAEIAARLIARAQNGDARDKNALLEWTQSAPGRSELVTSLQRGWDAVDELLDTPLMDQWRSEARQLLDSHAGAEETADGVSRGLPVWKAMMALAATVIIGFIGSMWLTAPRSPAEIAVSAPSNAIRIAKLSDGSVVTLDRGATAKAYYDNTLRRVVLEGQASFQVAHETTGSRPFVVRVADREIKATGTRFNVLQDSDRLEISLLSGGVLISGIAEKKSWLGLRREIVARPITKLSPGHRWTERAYKAPTITAFDSAEVSAWESGRIILKSETLGRAAEIVSRYSATKVIIADASLASRRVSGAFAIGNVEGFTEAVGLLYPDARITTQPGSVVITPRY